MNYYVYLILAVACFTGEMFTMEFSLACLGIGALGAAGASWFDLALWPQVGAFALLSAICWAGIRPFALKHLYGQSKRIQTPAEAVIGQECLAENDIDPVQGTGRVKVNGESWKAAAAAKIPANTICVVEKLDGVTLTVRPKN